MNNYNIKHVTGFQNDCDMGHNTPAEIRKLPLGGGSNALLCYRCYQTEMNWRKEQNKDLTPDCQFDCPSWFSLEVVEKSEYSLT